MESRRSVLARADGDVVMRWSGQLPARVLEAYGLLRRGRSLNRCRGTAGLGRLAIRRFVCGRESLYVYACLHGAVPRASADAGNARLPRSTGTHAHSPGSRGLSASDRASGSVSRLGGLRRPGWKRRSLSFPPSGVLSESSRSSSHGNERGRSFT
jgi:hypothetical protein